MSENCNLSRVLFVEGDEVKNETHLTSLFHERNIYQSLYITESAQRNWHAAPGVFASHGVPVRLGRLSRAPHTLFRRCAFGVQPVYSRFLALTCKRLGA